MPSPAPDSGKRVHRKINPATSPVEELLAHLATDPATGLSQREAERRLDHATTTPLFGINSRRFSEHIKRALREPSLWILRSVAIISLFFDRVGLGLVCLLLSIGHTFLCAYLSWRADRVDAAMQQAYDAPMPRVLRGRRPRRIGANSLVRGDILLLHAGDMVPADCRLLRTDDFVVTEWEIHSEGGPAVRLEKDANATPETTGNFRISPVNMVFAGGVVEEGFAIAVVVSVGNQTHLGGLCDRIEPAHPKHSPRLLANGARGLSTYNICLICLAVPLIAVGIFTVGSTAGGRYEFVDIFLSAVALSTLTLTEHLLAKGLYLFATPRRDAATDRDPTATADIKTAADLEKLTTVTDLLLIGTAALHDGVSHPETLLVGSTTYHCDAPEADEAAGTIAEYIYIYRRGAIEAAVDQRPWMPPAIEPISATLCNWAETDMDALSLKARSITASPNGVTVVLPTVEGNSRLTIRLTADVEDLAFCHEIFTAGATRYALAQGTGEDAATLRRTPADERLEELRAAHCRAMEEGLSALFVITSVAGRSTVRAMLTYAPHTCRKTAGAVRSLESAGIRVAAFLRDADAAHLRALAACGLTSEESPALTRPAQPATELLTEGHRAYLACSNDYIRRTISDLQAAGRTVAVLSVDSEDLPLLSAADVAITCSPSFYASAEEGMPALDTCDREFTRRDGAPNATMASDLTRRRADVLIRRTTPTGGGILGVRHALLCADRTKAALDRAFAFTLLSQAARVVATVLPLCLGLTLASAPALLLSGMVVDFVVFLAALALPADTAPAPRRPMDRGLTAPWNSYRTRLVATAIAAALPWLVVGIAHLAGVRFGGDLTYLNFLCLLGLQIAIFRTDRLPRRNRHVFFATLAIALLYVGALAAAIGSGLGPLWALLCPLISPAVYVLTVWLAGKILPKA